MTIEEKEKAKALFGFKAVPFCVVFDADGKLLKSGDPKTIDFSTVFTPVAGAESTATSKDNEFEKINITDENTTPITAEVPPAELIFDDDF